MRLSKGDCCADVIVFWLCLCLLAFSLVLAASSPLPQDAGRPARGTGCRSWPPPPASCTPPRIRTMSMAACWPCSAAATGRGVSLLTLNRGESGDNAIGPQLFDGLGLIRTEELAVSDRYYGVDRQYFTSVVDYGFSKRLEEAFDKWGRENVLRDVVRIIRTERPLIIVSRFQGNQRDGHGNHQTAGLITQNAFEAAADPKMFPDQIQAGLRPWQAMKLYIGGMREDEDWTVRVDTGAVQPVAWRSATTTSRAPASASSARRTADG